MQEGFFNKYGKADVVILDPPRGGIHKKIVKKLLNRKTVFVFGQSLALDHKNDYHHLPLHQELNDISNDCAVIWCPLIKLSKKTGSLCLIPGSHKFGHLIYKRSKIPAEKHKIGLVDKIIKGEWQAK
mgnify:CR=1 FL=1